jgi:hypothetical protein
MSFSQCAQRLGWHHYYHYEINMRIFHNQSWKTVYQGFSCLGGVPVLEFTPIRARYVLLEIIKERASDPVQLAELRLFGPISDAGTHPMRSSNNN